MAAWPVITVDDLADYLVGAQVSALRQAALASGQSDPFGRVMPDRASYVRNRISHRIRISATANAIPPELKTALIMFVIEYMMGRLRLELTEDQRSQIRRAYRDLDIAGTDKLPISEPDDPVEAPVQTGAAGVVVSKSTRLADRESLKGL